jgi:hypothetical protein
MNPAAQSQFWNECRTQLLNFRANPANIGPVEVEALRQRLETAAAGLDPNRRTSKYNLPSPDQDQMTAVLSKTVYLANLWIHDGRPAVPNV